MKLLGIYLGRHDSNISIVEDGKVSYYKAERLLNHKHKRANLEWVKALCTEKQFVPDVVCFSDGNRNNLGICDVNELFKECTPLSIFPNTKTFCIDHHYAHVLSAWPILKGDSVNYGVTIDGRGDHLIRCSIIKNPFDLLAASVEFKSTDHEYCFTFNQIGQYMNLSGGELDFAGKIMGAHAYGKVDNEFVDLCNTRYYETHPLELLKVDYRNRSAEDICKEKGETFDNWLSSIHKLLEIFICNLFDQYVPRDATVVYAGGGAQNTVYNERLAHMYGSLIIPPHCYDGGISLGCVKLLSLMLNEKLEIAVFPFSQDDADVDYASEKVIEQVVDLLLDNKIVGWCQGKGEIGPRALGHRSILMNPANPNGKSYLNERVKQREYWRPYAASIKRESISKLTGMDRDCPYMLHALHVNDQYHDSLRSVIHVDGTCRFQTVENTGVLKTYYRVLDLFEQASGYMGILNTSLNLGGKPIVSTENHALELYRTIDLDAICIGNKLLIK